MATQGVVDSAVSVSRHDSALGSWERAWQRPSRALRHLVAGYTGYQQRLAAPAVHRGIPGPTLPLVISFGPPQTITAAQPGHPAVTVDSFLAGLHDRHVLIKAEAYHGIQVDLRPVAAYRLLAQPLTELTGQVVGLDVLFGPDAERLIDDLACARDWPTRFRRLDRFLLHRLAVAPLPVPEVARAWQLIVESRGRVHVGELAADCGWSQRHLATRFTQVLGLSPKRMARLVRFDHAAALLSRPATGGLAGVAAAAGYYDQSHLTHEVRAFTGLTPTQLLAGRLPDDGGVFDMAGR